MEPVLLTGNELFYSVIYILINMQTILLAKYELTKWFVTQLKYVSNCKRLEVDYFGFVNMWLLRVEDKSGVKSTQACQSIFLGNVKKYKEK